jgi:hypothetical protein
MAKRSGRRVRLFTRNGKDWSELFPAVVTAVQQLDISSCLIDGEIVVCDEHGLGRCRATIKVRGHGHAQGRGAVRGGDRDGTAGCAANRGFNGLKFLT